MRVNIAGSVVITIMLWLLSAAVGVCANQDDNLDGYQKQLLGRIKDGRLTSAEEKGLMKLYTFVKGSDKIHRRNFWERRALWYLVAQLDRSMDGELGDFAMDGSTSCVSRRLADLHEGIEQGRHSGQLTAVDCDRLKGRLLSIEQQRCVFPKDSLSALESNMLDEDLDDLERDFYQQLTGSECRTRVGPLDNRLYSIRVKIDQGIGDYKLTRAEANNLNCEFARLRDLEDRWSTSSGYVTSWEWDTLVRLTQLLDRSVDFKLGNKLRATPPALSSVNPGHFRNGVQTHYLWYHSRHGGYYDASGQINGVMFTNELYRYGGVMSDGTMVPENSDTGSNFARYLYPTIRD